MRNLRDCLFHFVYLITKGQLCLTFCGILLFILFVIQHSGCYTPIYCAVFTKSKSFAQIRQLITITLTVHGIVGFVDPIGHARTNQMEVCIFFIVVNNKRCVKLYYGGREGTWELGKIKISHGNDLL